MAIGLAGCANGLESGTPESLADLVVPDEDFTFATAKTIELDLRVAEGTAPAAVEVADAEGRRIMNGAFLDSAKLNVKLPAHHADSIKVRVGQGDQAVVRDISVADGRATANLGGE